MSKHRIRFTGRLVFAERGSGGALDIVAIDPGSVAELDFARHRLFLTVPRSSVDSAATTRAPDFVIVTPGELRPSQLELAVWDLGGQDVRISGSGGLRWVGTSRGLLADLGDLTKGLGIFQESADRAVSVIRLSAGDIEPKVLGKSVSFGFVPLKNLGAPKIRVGQLADIVDVVVEAGEMLTFDLSPHPPSAVATAQRIAIKTDAQPGTITVSHLCSSNLDQGVDKEFAALYGALENPPPVPDRLIPTAVGALADYPCFAPAYIHYESKLSTDGAKVTVTDAKAKAT